ncbi:hypothetical protein THAOC_18433 [Thalassiosira oceanica]|uniref:Uncharacterized protein n=1 Tax=Thalassiosira oceanica TaxID=159749 RepID=K0SS52_THAOC|nr:hypothetical protein THAOC_18433 [Thalassiosira oceanica]|eukprot:EJK61127.1 hypothetical protein THAOC_18433 [Thalassiosira oceanica]
MPMTMPDAVAPVLSGDVLGMPKLRHPAQDESKSNALLLANVDTNVIRLIGRWRSDEMLRYLHVQAAPLMQDYARRMVAGGHYNLLPNAQLVPQELLPANDVVPMH